MHIRTTVVALALVTAAAAPAVAQDTQQDSKKPEPFTFADFTWLVGKSTHQRVAARHETVHRRVPRLRVRSCPAFTPDLRKSENRITFGFARETLI